MSKENTIISLLKEINKNIDNVKPAVNLEDITITDNGEYTPSEGFDGFGKVNVDLRGKVKIYGGLKFYPLHSNKVVNPNAEILDTTGVTSLTGLCYNYSMMTKCDVSEWDTSNVTNMNDMFNGSKSIKTLDLTSFDASKCIGWWGTLSGMLTCESLVGGRSYEDVVNNNITILKGKSTSDNMFIKKSEKIDRASLRALINGLADLTDTTTQTLTLGATLRAKLTEEDIAIATAKNWSIA